MKWDVVRLCERQLRDVNPKDILNGGLYRRCNTYKGGGGYDKFPEIYTKRFGKVDGLNNQFVVQLRGCPLRCPYCYVTEEGVLTGEGKFVSTGELIDAYRDSGCKVFHLMGGAPALYIDKWNEILSELNQGEIFHSDLLLLEGEYDKSVIKSLACSPESLYAVSIKGANSEEFFKNTGVKFDSDLFWRNFDTLVRYDFPFYLTFTGMSENSILNFKQQVFNRYASLAEWVLRDSFGIELVKYKALED